MTYPYSYYYGYSSSAAVFGIAILVAIILAVVFYFTFLSKKNEGKFTGTKEKIYNFFSFNRFYTEEVLKLFYIVSAAVITVIGVMQLFSGVSGLVILIVGNVVLRICYELMMMFIILCRKTVSVDKKLDKIVGFYGDDFDEGECHDNDEEGDCESCEQGDCCCSEGEVCVDCDEKECGGCDGKEPQEPGIEVKEDINASER